jgi:hypothetical protein
MGPFGPDAGGIGGMYDGVHDCGHGDAGLGDAGVDAGGDGGDMLWVWEPEPRWHSHVQRPSSVIRGMAECRAPEFNDEVGEGGAGWV